MQVMHCKNLVHQLNYSFEICGLMFAFFLWWWGKQIDRQYLIWIQGANSESLMITSLSTHSLKSKYFSQSVTSNWLSFPMPQTHPRNQTSQVSHRSFDNGTTSSPADSPITSIKDALLHPQPSTEGYRICWAWTESAWYLIVFFWLWSLATKISGVIRLWI